MFSDGFVDAVGSTAFMIAAARAIETHREDGLIHDEFAKHFVASAAEAGLSLPTRTEDVELGEEDPVWGHGAAYSALRTRVFDDFLEECASGDVTQMVLLGAGLDMRAFRLPWSSDVKFYEIDRAALMSFKSAAIGRLGAETGARHSLLSVDLAEDWSRVLLAHDFDPGTPTAWVAEGLLPYLSAATEERLMRSIDELSTSGSRIGFEILLRQETAQVREHSLYETTATRVGSNVAELFSAEGRPDSIGLLRASGWELVSSPVAEFTARYGRGPDPTVDDPIKNARWVIGQKNPR